MNELETPTQHVITGQCHLRGRDIDGAILEFEKAIRLDPGYIRRKRPVLLRSGRPDRLPDSLVTQGLYPIRKNNSSI